MAGFGWIGAGIVNLFTWYIIMIRHVPSSYPNASLALSLLVFAVGILVLAFRKRINTMIDEKTAKHSGRMENSNSIEGNRTEVYKKQNK